MCGQIAVCDDEMTELNKLRLCLERWQKQHPDFSLEVEYFTGAAELKTLFHAGEYQPDLLLLDIYIGDETGIDVAEEYRKMGTEGAIVFITASKEHALEAFGVNALQYLVKPLKAAALYSILDSLFIGRHKARRSCILLRIDGQMCRVVVDGIIYCRAQGKKQYLHFQHGEQKQLRLSMTELYEKLADRQQFVRVGASYIVNLDHIDSLDAQKICMDNGEQIFLPRGAYQPLREQYFRYYCGKEEI